MKLLRISTFPISLKVLLSGQMRFLVHKGFQVQMVSADGKERQAVIDAEGCPHHIIPFTRAITPLQDLYCLWLLIRLIRRFRPQIIHTHTPKAGLLGMLAAKITAVPIRIHTVAGLPFMTAQGRRRRLLITMEKLTYWAAHQVWPNSQMMLKYMKDKKLCPVNKLSIISKGSSNGIDVERFSSNSLKKKQLDFIKNKINYDPSSTYLLTVGRIVKDKGIVELLEVFIQLHQDKPNLKLILLGPFEYERKEEVIPDKYHYIIQNHPAIQHITWSDEVEYYMHLADILVHASHREGFPNVLLQAGLMKCPIVCSDISGNMDIIEPEKTGLSFSVGQQSSLKKSIKKALISQSELKKGAFLLQKSILEKYDRKIIHQNIFEEYLELLGTL